MKRTVRKRLAGTLTGCLAAAACFLAVSERSDGQASPTPEMLQIFQGLSPEQQDAILKQFTGGGAGSSGGGAMGALQSVLGGGQSGAKEAQAGRRQAETEQAKPEEEEGQEDVRSSG